MPDFLPFSESNPSDPVQADQVLQQQVKRLYEVTLHMRWTLVRLLWLSVAPLSLWGLRHEFRLWLDYFTWTAVRYGLIYNPLSAFGLMLCTGLTLSTLFWQGHHILFGISPQYQRRLEKQVIKICKQGKSHPLWKKICNS